MIDLCWGDLTDGLTRSRRVGRRAEPLSVRLRPRRTARASQPTVSHHLSMLVDAALARTAWACAGRQERSSLYAPGQDGHAEDERLDTTDVVADRRRREILPAGSSSSQSS